MLNFYHRFLKNAASVQACLHDLVKGKAKKDKSVIAWSVEAKIAFQACKDVLVQSTILAYPKYDAQLSLVTDASETAIGAVLQQHVDGSSEPLGFFSRKLTPAERKYRSAKFFRHFLEGRDFVVFTDHKPLTFAFKQNHEKN
ncbi:hypothetical protein AVEN_196985-1 [Araneus ventricosus]|uniref:Reverse transcriptase/retrotransposon-derived protein RNase H-like domain-containing protein n=1 Tax=Araneus ventricosus TaxID=182803 RepID=A0A4Y2EDM9_ARAVE|nr:hypothetical protein AVEN_196985-1 [Araneus ventricosus]